MDCASVTKQKATACKREANKTGGCASAVRPLTTDEENVLGILLNQAKALNNENIQHDKRLF